MCTDVARTLPMENIIQITIPHTSGCQTFSMRALNVSVLEDRFESLKKIPKDELLRKSPLNTKPSL